MEVTSAMTGLEGMIHHTSELGEILKIFFSNTFNLLDEFTEFQEKTDWETSLAVQQLRIYLAMYGTWV